MRAWEFRAAGEPLALVERPDPRPAAHELVVAPFACGFCHTDVNYSDGTLTAILPQLPMVLGHEIAGRVSAMGRDVDGFSVGQRVAIRAGADSPGNVSDGGFSTAVVTPDHLVVPVPDGVSDVDAAIATDAGLTAYHAVHTQGQVAAGHRVGIIGLGGLGYFGAQIAQVAGAEVLVAEPHAAALENSRRFGYAGYAADIAEFAGAELDVVIDFAGYGTTTSGAMNAVRERGRVVQIGMGVTDASLSMLTLVARQLTLVGAVGGTNDDLAAVLDLLASGTITSRTETIGFDEIPHGLVRLAAGGLTERLVAVF